MSSVQTMSKFKINHKFELLLAFSVTLVTCCICLHIGNPLIRLNVQDASEHRVNCILNFETVVLTQEQKEDAIKAASELELHWFPTDLNSKSIKGWPQMYDAYINLVFPEQLFIDVFLLPDGNLIVLVSSWHNDLIYQARNPECMYPFIKNLIN